MTVVTRFAPSPTGFLHIGGARTALYNWLYARHMRGKFLLRIEDTDRKRSTPEAVDALLDGLNWLGLLGDEEPVFQSARRDRHVEVANDLLARGQAYRCYCSPEELAEMRAAAKAQGRAVAYDGRWRERSLSEAPAGIDPVIRLKCPRDGDTVIEDQVQGRVTVANAQIDDYVILRADGTPTYMLSAVVDDHDMGVTHVIRGDDHLTNAFRQTRLYAAMGWQSPRFAHIPLIHGADGTKLSKRHGALGVDAYRDEMGLLPEAVKNYLLRLGWGHGDEEIISQDRAIGIFDVTDIGKAAARFDPDKMIHLNGVYMRQSDDQRLVALISPKIAAMIGAETVPDTARKRLLAGMPGLKERAKNILDLAENAAFYAKSVPLDMTPKAAKLLNEAGKAHLQDVISALETIEDWSHDALETAIQQIAERKEVKLGKIAQPIRAALTGSNISPGVFDIMCVLEKQETLARIRAAAA